MVRKTITHIRYPVLIAVMVLRLVAVAQAAGGNIDAVDKWAWGTNVGWINFAPTHGGVTVYDDHLEGYAWGENIGWIRLGTYEGGDAHTYANDAADNYGVKQKPASGVSGSHSTPVPLSTQSLLSPVSSVSCNHQNQQVASPPVPWIETHSALSSS